VTVLRAGDIDPFLNRPDPRRSVILIYGSDSGLVSERTSTILRRVSGEGGPFAVVPLEGDTLASDPGLLLDEVDTFGLFGNRRIVHVRAGSKNFAAAIEPLLKNPPQAIVIIEAGELRTTSPLRALCERSPLAATIPCYIDDERTLLTLVERSLAEAGVSIESDAREELIHLLGADRLATRGELDKLALYAKGKGRIQVEDVRAVIADSSALVLDDIMDSAAAGEPQAALTALKKAFAAGISPTSVLSAAIRHIANLHRLSVTVERGGSIRTAIENSRPKLFFRRWPRFELALHRFDTAMLEGVMITLAASNLDARKKITLAGTIAERAILRIAYANRSTKNAAREVSMPPQLTGK
jgi:DNA polymerase III subunit delta